MVKVIFVFVFLLLTGAGALVSADTGKLHLTVLAFGDSITQGLASRYDGEGRKIVWGILNPPLGRPTNDWGYPIALDKRIESSLQNDLGLSQAVTVSVFNWGHSGWTSLDALDIERPQNCIDTVLGSQPADFILLLFGANDLYHGLSSKTTKFNLEQMINKSISAGVEPIIGTITPNTHKYAPFRRSAIEEFYNPVIRSLADEKGILLADHYEAMVQDWNLLWTSGDGLHLSREGNEKMADTWYASLIKSEFFVVPPLISPVMLLLLDKT